MSDIMNSKNKVLTKSQIIKVLAKKHNLTQEVISNIMSSFISMIYDSVENAEVNVKCVQITDFCQIRVQERPAKVAKSGINPFTGKPIEIKAKPATKYVRIKPLKALNDASNGTNKKTKS